MTLRIGLLGASRIAPKAILQPASRRDDVVVTAAAGRDPERTRAYAQAHGIGAVAADYAALVVRDDVDLVYCALPPAAHLESCLLALAAGKALLVEKPFAMTTSDAQAIAVAAGRGGRPALEAFHYRFHSQFERTLQLLRDGAIGRVRRAEGLFEAEIRQAPDELRWSPTLGGGSVMDLGCYLVHALRTLLGGEPTVVAARADLRQGVDAAMDATLMFPGDVAGQVRSSMLGPRRDEIRLHGDDGELSLQAFVSPQNGGRIVLTTRAGVGEEPASGPPSYDAQLDHVMRVLAGDAEPLTGGEDAVANMAVLDAMRRMAGIRLPEA